MKRTKILITLIALIISVANGNNIDANEQSDNQIKTLFKILKTSSNNSLRLNAIRKLQHIKSKKIIEPVLFALNDKSSFVRIKAAKILGGLNYPKTINPLIRRLKIEKELFVQKEIILTLGKLKDQKARWIIKTFAKNKNITLKQSAKVALAMIENDK